MCGCGLKRRSGAYRIGGNKQINLHKKVWRQYEMKHKPAAILNIEAPPGKEKNILGSAL